jgi:tetratricopeptide (TPR) repeat protein
MFNLNKSSLIASGKKQIISLLFIAFSFTVFAQKSFYENTDLFYKKVEELVSKSQFDNALKIIDTLSQKNTFFSCANKNYLKGYVYEVKFKKNKNQNDFDSSFHYFSISLSCIKEYNGTIIQQMHYFANIYHNKAADALNPQKIDSAEFYYSQSRKALLLVDSSIVYKRDIEFYLASGSTYIAIYENERETNKIYLEKSVNYYKKVLALDSNNYSANFNIMIAYYNTAVTELRKADYCKQVDIANSVDWANPNKEIPSIEKLLECIKPEEFEKYSFTPAIKKALPFALKAYKINPSNKHVLQALVGIYFAIDDKKAVSKYKNELKKLK